MKRAIINYFKNFNIFFPVIKAVILSVILGTALLILDFYDVPTCVLNQIPSTILAVCAVSALIIVFCWLYYIHFWGLFLIASASILDVTFVTLFFTVLTYYLFNLKLLQSRYLFSCAIICFVFAALIGVRIVFHFCSQKKAQCLKTNVLDLKDLYDNTFDYTGHGPILIEEAEVSYDLLENGVNEEIMASRKEQLEQLHKSLCKAVFDNNINLYSDDYYHPRNIRGLYSYCKELCPEAFKPYIASIISEQNIYKIIWDITARSIGSEYSYSISKESLEIFFDNSTVIEKILSSTQPKTESEKFVKEIYMSFKDGKADFFGDKAVRSTEEIKPIL